MSGERAAPARLEAPPVVRAGLVVLVDLAAILALVGLALVGLRGTFAGWGFLVVGLAGGCAALLVVLATSRLPGSALVAALPIAAIVLGGPIALREGGLGAGIPDLQLLADVMAGCATGWHELLTTLPYVDLAGPPALVPYVLGFAGAGLSAALALRGRSAGLPLLPLFAVLVVVLLLRRPEGDLLDWYPVAFVATSVVWLVFRGLEFSADLAAPVRGREHGRLARTVTAAVVVAAGLGVSVPLTSGRPATAGASLRGQVAAAPELAGLDSPLRRFRTFTEQRVPSSENVHRKLLLTVSGAPAGSRLRLLTLDRYDGDEWLPGDDTVRGETDDAFLRMDSRLDNHVHGRHLRVQVGVERAYRSAWVPTIGSLTSLRFLLDDASSRRAQLRYDPATSTAVVPVGIHGGNDYEFTSIQPDDRLTRTMAPWPEPVLSVAGIHAADPLIRKVLASPAPPMRKVFLLATYLREEGRYSNGSAPGESQYTAGHSLARLTSGFLLARRPVGDDEQYAAAMALLANRVGVPARVVVGALVPRDGKVRGEDVHAWVEVRVADGSWRTLPTRVFMGDQPPRPNMSAARPPQVPPKVAVPAPPPSATEVTRSHELEHQARAERRSTALRWVPWSLLLVLGLVVPSVKQTRRGLRRRTGRPSDQVAGAWSELVDHARDLGVPVVVGATRPSQARTIARADDLARLADDRVFASTEPDQHDVGELWRRARAERRALARAQHPLRRAWAPFNPRSLARPSRASGRASHRGRRQDRR